MLNFDFLGKGLGIISPTHFMYDFSRKMSIHILVNMCIETVPLRGCDAINFEIHLIFLFKSFLDMTKNSRQKLKSILRATRAFKR